MFLQLPRASGGEFGGQFWGKGQAGCFFRFMNVVNFLRTPIWALNCNPCASVYYQRMAAESDLQKNPLAPEQPQQNPAKYTAPKE